MCKKTFTTKQAQTNHEKKCPKKANEVEIVFRELLKEKDKQIAQLREQINKLQDKLAHIAEAGVLKREKKDRP
jgi:polyhydroxyalkanoate synthesis regulator phasin